MPAMSTTLHTLYRFYDASDQLLYVGITNDPPRRFSKHRDDKAWWTGVARIDLEMHQTRHELAAAERAAIESERPLHNIRMNGGRPHRVAETTLTDGLVGRWFHSYEPLEDDDNHAYCNLDGKGNKRVWQGQVIDHEGSLLVLQLYSWWDGCPTNQVVYPVDGMAHWRFFVSSQEMQTADGCTEDFGSERGGICGAPCTHVIRDFVGLGPVYRCGRCIGFYSGKAELL